jgi:hypothetical protein
MIYQICREEKLLIFNMLIELIDISNNLTEVFS